ncbi:MAG: ABC transporter ATP-binding protein [Acidobacteriota bacterium]
MPTATLIAEHLEKRFSGRTLFSGLNLRIERGLVAVAGRNGSGKTTLLKILAGLARPSAGSVRIEREGRSLAGQERRLAVGWAGPDLALYGELTAPENLRFFRVAAGRGGDPDSLGRRLIEAGLAEEALARPIEEFSSGMTQRLRVVFAQLFDPPVLLLDEPMTGLDAAGRAIVQRAVARAREQGAVVLASNDERDFDGPDQRIALGGDAT